MNYTTHDIDFIWKDDPFNPRRVSVVKATRDLTEDEFDELLDLENDGGFFAFRHDEEILGDQGEFIVLAVYDTEETV